jgi:glutamyl-tRNA synthetase
MSEVRVRIAPSPTGPPHVGTAYTALFNLAFARRHQGRFVLRIEDTDQNRSRPEYEEGLLKALRWVGIEWDEGPDVGGPYAPYRQSERLELYHRYAAQLVEQGDAYYCFCSSERLEALRAEQRRQKQSPRYDGHCRYLPAGEVAGKLAQGLPRVIRLKMPREGTSIVKDVLRGGISFEYGLIDDQVLLKSDGFPTYHLAVVVDDHLMKITHVIRGEEWINSTPKHLLLYQCLGWEPPAYAHQPLLLNPDRSKLSKRRNPTSLDYYRRAGYLGPALLNYLALMAYPAVGEDEKFTVAQFSEGFELERISLGGSVFDLTKLNWLNGRYLREDFTAEGLLQELKRWLLNDEYIGRMLPLVQVRMETLGDFMPKCAFFFARQVEPAVEDLVPKDRPAPEVAQMLQTALWALEKALPWNRDTGEEAVRRVAAFWDWPIRDITVPLIAAIAGQKVGPPLFESIALLGLDLVRMRLLDAINLLGGLSKNKAADLEERWSKG